MAKRGRPTISQKMKEFYGDLVESPEDERYLRIMNILITDGKDNRNKINAYYSACAVILFSSFPVPYWDEVDFKYCITEQLGRLVAQDHYTGNGIIEVARVAAAAYHAGYTAKAVTSWIKGVRETGIVDSGFLVAATENQEE